MALETFPYNFTTFGQYKDATPKFCETGAGSWVSLPVSISGRSLTGQTGLLVAQTGHFNSADKKHESESDFVRECQPV